MTTDFDEDALRAYHDQSAPPELRARIEAAAAQDPTLRAELAVMRGLQELAAAEPAPLADELGWQRLKAQIAQEEAPVAAPPRQNWLRLAAALLAALVVGQGAYIVSTRPGPALYETATVAAPAHVLVLAFEGTAPAEAITALLRAQGARVIDGPSALGLYRVAFDSAAAQAAARAAFQDAPIIQMVGDP